MKAYVHVRTPSGNDDEQEEDNGGCRKIILWRRRHLVDGSVLISRKASGEYSCWWMMAGVRC